MVTFGLYQNFSEVGFQDYQYTVIDIGNLGGPLENTIPIGMNNKGQVVGQSQNSAGEWHAFVWSAGEGMKDLGTLGGKESRAISINENGDVFGESQVKNGKARRFRWSNGKMTDLGPTDTGVLRFDDSQAVGNVAMMNGTSQEAAYWNNGGVERLGTLGGNFSTARGYTTAGVVVGEAESNRQRIRPTIWVPQGKKKYVAKDLFETLNAPELEGRALNVSDAGQVVGEATSNKGNYAFVWNAQEGVRDLNPLLRDSDPGVANKTWTLNKATAVNNCGQIAGEGNASDKGGGRAFLLTPLGTAVCGK
ncbi:MAG: hypothetical protein ABL958_01940 [Bdellovibrionia bacterium]